MANLIVLFWDQLSHSISSLEGYDKSSDIVLMCELKSQAVQPKHHKQKLVLLFSAMRHFAAELKERGYTVEYRKLNAADNTDNLQTEVNKALKKYKLQNIICTEPSEYHWLQELKSWQSKQKAKIQIVPDNRFLINPEEFNKWIAGKREPRMEFFYRFMRQKHNILMQGTKPIGDRWNYDTDNRNPIRDKVVIPKTYHSKPDELTAEVIKLVSDNFADHFGSIDSFAMAVTAKQAKYALSKFIKERLALFGDYQDAMLTSEPWLYHSHLSFYLNCGLLLPRECIDAAVKAYTEGQADINSVEGFVRQILGWREYVRGIYWNQMPKYRKLNFFNAKRKLPSLYWDADTKMNCLKQAVSETRDNAYAHHIQRLMVLGNFALLTGVNPNELNEWFWIVYADAYEWVELPNVSGMVLFADGGLLASKPYAAGGNYINKMSDYCKNCHYKVKEKTGPDACPFNYLYWDFLARNRDKLAHNRRLALSYTTFDKMSKQQKSAIHKDAKGFLDSLV